MVQKMRKEVSLYFFSHLCPYGRNLLSSPIETHAGPISPRLIFDYSDVSMFLYKCDSSLTVSGLASLILTLCMLLQACRRAEE